MIITKLNSSRGLAKYAVSFGGAEYVAWSIQGRMVKVYPAGSTSAIAAFDPARHESFEAGLRACLAGA